MARAVIPCRPLISLANSAEVLRQNIGVELDISRQDMPSTDGQLKLELLKSARMLLGTIDNFASVITDSKTVDRSELDACKMLVEQMTLQLAVMHSTLCYRLGDI